MLEPSSFVWRTLSDMAFGYSKGFRKFIIAQDIRYAPIVWVNPRR